MSLKSHLVQRIVKKNPSLKDTDVGMILNVFFASIIDYLQNNNRVELRGFGSFSTRSYHIFNSPRLSRSNYRKIYFRPSQKLIRSVNQK